MLSSSDLSRRTRLIGSDGALNIEMAGTGSAMTADGGTIAMCMACQEMELFYAYLDAIEEEKRKQQPWQCEVTVIPQDGAPEKPEPPAATKPAAKSGFACDAPE